MECINIAIFISGRITRYEDCLKKMLEKCPYNIDLFLSLNSTECEYNNIMQKELSKWLKGIYLKPFVMPIPWIHNHPHNYAYQLVNEKYIPLYQMSMYFNDHNAYEMIYKYSKENNIEYDYVMKLRADMYDYNWPILD